MGEIRVLRMDGKVNKNAPLRHAVAALKKVDGLLGTSILLVGLVFIKALAGAAKVCFDTRLYRVFHGGIRMEIHIGIAGGAGGDHLQQRQPVADADVLLCKLILNGHHLFKQPLL